MAAAATRKQPADAADPRPQEGSYDALLVVAFGGPEGMNDVIPFLENVTRGRNVPPERLAAVGHHYELFGGVSPINRQNRDLIAALETELAAHAIELPIYLGNRNWHPYLADTLRAMRAAGSRRALAFFTSAFSSYSSCRQYRENIYEAQLAVGDDAPEVLKLRAFYNHPGFIEANADRVRDGLARIPVARRATTPVVFTAHSIPSTMAKHCRYADQLAECARLVAQAAGAESHSLVFQSRSGSPHVLDVEAHDLAAEIGLNVVRAGTAGTHPAYVSMIRELIEERLDEDAPRRVVGRFGANPDVCPTNCCLPGNGEVSPWNREPKSGASGDGIPPGGEQAREHDR